jgi:hypothetical protein
MNEINAIDCIEEPAGASNMTGTEDDRKHIT